MAWRGSRSIRRECENSAAQLEVLNKLEACLFPEAIQYTYNGYYGSCQTFCSRILGSALFEELNPEAFLTSAFGLKAIASWWLGGEANAGELVKEMNNRFENPTAYDVPPQDGRHVKTYPESSRLGQHLLILTAQLERDIALGRVLSKTGFNTNT